MLFIITYIKRITLLLLLYTTSRLFFYFNNIDDFYNPRIVDFIEGVRFDISSILYINIPILILLLFPNKYRERKNYIRFTNYLFYSLNIPFIILNNIDIEYFKFTQKRSTSDLFQLIQLGQDAKNTIPKYINDYWLISIFTIIQIWFLLKIKKIPKKSITFNTKNIVKSSLIFIIGIGVFILGARGGFQLKPIKPINAGELSSSKNTSLILNTPFCILHSIKEKPLKTYHYYNSQQLKNIYSPIHLPMNQKIKKKNIIILIMESYSKEFVSFYNNGIGYTPFLDTLMNHSLVFTNAYANGLKSIEALPAITASIPTLMDNPFITSNYAQNNFESLASLLNNKGYNTSFYHGGIKGTMGFYSYTKKAGFTNYFGMEEHPNPYDFDGFWGIYDGPFMKYFAKNLNKHKEPFFSTFFSLSSHPPYNLPNNYTKKTYPNKDDQNFGIKETVLYTDYSMKFFFDEVKNQKWFKNTIFIITADHTSPKSFNKKYKNKIGRYAIPLIIFSGDSSLQGINNNIVQHIDIMPTILELINYPEPFFAFGKSMFNKQNWAINFLNNRYHLITDSSIIINKEDRYHSFTDWSTSKNNKLKLKDRKLLKAIKQEYNSRMLNNILLYEN